MADITLHSFPWELNFADECTNVGGVSSFVQNKMYYTAINMDRYSDGKDIEICVLKLHISLCTIIIVTVYRSPTSNKDCFLNNLEEALNLIYNNTVDIILCGHFNLNYLNDNQDKQALNSLLTSYSLYSITNF